MPLIMREIVYRLLQGEQGDQLCHIAFQEGHTHRIARAIQYLRKELGQPLQIDDIAQELGMSVSSFYHHFKEVTALSPLQYQKRYATKKPVADAQ
jgi:AraC-like DNA-binding protein